MLEDIKSETLKQIINFVKTLVAQRQDLAGIRNIGGWPISKISQKDLSLSKMQEKDLGVRNYTPTKQYHTPTKQHHTTG